MTDRAPSDELPTDEIRWIGGPHTPEEMAMARAGVRANRRRRSWYCRTNRRLAVHLKQRALAWVLAMSTSILAGAGAFIWSGLVMPGRVSALEKARVVEDRLNQTRDSTISFLARVAKWGARFKCGELHGEAFTASAEICGEVTDRQTFPPTPPEGRN